MEPILFFVKFGKLEHLKEILSNSIYFNTAKKLAQIEAEQGKKGQGDAFEGKTLIKGSAKLYDQQTGALICEFDDVLLNLAYQFIPERPVFCLTVGYEKDCIMRNENEYEVSFSTEVKEEILRSFPDADSALVIKNPTKFVNDIYKIFDGNCVSQPTNYYFGFSDGMITTEMIEFIMGGKPQCQTVPEDTVDPNGNIIEAHAPKIPFITSENIHKVLFCKDSSLKNQQEYRFVGCKSSIQQPMSFPYIPTSDMELINIHDFFNSYQCIIYKEGTTK